MANKIGSNFLLPAKVFLDKRQGIVSGIGELGTWDYDKYPIPDGFEVFVDGKWYTYYKDIGKDSITGFSEFEVVLMYFKPQVHLRMMLCLRML